jgi:transcriptional regulator with XRE-family HTH domain
MRQKGNEFYDGIPTQDVGPALARLRERWGILQQQMADAMGITKNMYVRLEKGKKTTVSLEQLQQGLTVFTRQDYTVESVADLLQKSKEPLSWEQILAMDRRTQAAHDLRKLSRLQNENGSDGLVLTQRKEVEKFPRALGRVFRTLREEKGLSAEDVAATLNILPDALKRFESGRLPLSRERIKRIAGALESSFEKVIERLSDARGMSKDDVTAEMNEYFRSSLPPASHADRYAMIEEERSLRHR